MSFFYHHQDGNLQVILNHDCHNAGVYVARNEKYHLMCESLEDNRKFTYGKNLEVEN